MHHLERQAGQPSISVTILTIIFLVGAFVLAESLHIYQPFDASPMLYGILALCFFAVAQLASAGSYGFLGAKYFLFSLLPWLLAAVFIANGALDHSTPARYHTLVIEEHFNRKWMDSVVVRSWRPGRTRESVYLRRSNGFYHSNEGVTVSIKPGAFGIPWVSSVLRDRDVHAQ